MYDMKLKHVWASPRATSRLHLWLMKGHSQNGCQAGKLHHIGNPSGQTSLLVLVLVGQRNMVHQWPHHRCQTWQTHGFSGKIPQLRSSGMVGHLQSARVALQVEMLNRHQQTILAIWIQHRRCGEALVHSLASRRVTLMALGDVNETILQVRCQLVHWKLDLSHLADDEDVQYVFHPGVDGHSESMKAEAGSPRAVLRTHAQLVAFHQTLLLPFLTQNPACVVVFFAGRLTTWICTNITW